jgi:hypothetical protein
LNQHDPIPVRIVRVDHDTSPGLTAGPAREQNPVRGQIFEYVMKALDFDRDARLRSALPGITSRSTHAKRQLMPAAIENALACVS